MNTFIYKNLIKNQPNLCVSRKEKEDIKRVCSEIKDDMFSSSNCSLDDVYIDKLNVGAHCSRYMNFLKVYQSFTQRYPNLFLYSSYTSDRDLVLLKSSKIDFFPIAKMSNDINELIKKQVNEKLDGYLICNTSFQTKDSSHHFLVEISRGGDNDMFDDIDDVDDIVNITIKIIDVACWSDRDKEKFENTFNKIYENAGLTNVNINLIFTLDDYIENRDMSCYTTNLQMEEKQLFGIGYCVGWGLYFIHKLYIENEPIDSVYETLLSLDDKTRAKFIFIWYDLFFGKL